ncbi:uncharacterized protein CCR75_009580 [Bremia lactucae]|uniref:Uncharacterized protein n=1 Tax=Bremia lactucae TaxID=4779 RepID=A0A976FK88_BRELC|nr:hypothetical protein CCR75_009580 [Bremia lactucae]
MSYLALLSERYGSRMETVSFSRASGVVTVRTGGDAIKMTRVRCNMAGVQQQFGALSDGFGTKTREK